MRTIFIGAGHSAVDSGAVSPDKRFKESDIALKLRDLIAAECARHKVPCKTDGAIGQNSPLRDSIAIAKTCNGPRVELHLNAAATPTAKGIECLARRKHIGLAQRLCAAVNQVTGSPLRGDKGYKDQGAGQHHRLAFCVDADGLILELEFISNLTAMSVFMENLPIIAVRITDVLVAEALEDTDGPV